MYFGGFTFDSECPEKFLRIPNKVAAKRIAKAVLEIYKLDQSLQAALQVLTANGNINPALSSYRDLMAQRDNMKALTDMTEANHRDFLLLSKTAIPSTVSRLH